MHIKGIMVTLVTLLMAISSFGQLVPTVYTDKADYQPGEVVIIEGDGWRPGEQVKLEIDHSTITHGNTVLYATADDRGHIRNEQYVIQAIHWGESFILTATGMSSGFTATTTFTDGNAFTATVTPNSVNSGVSGSFTIRVSNISEISGQGQGQGQSAANVRSVEIAIPAGWTGIATTSITTSSNASSTFSFETGTGYTNGYNSSIGNGVIRCKAVTGNGLQADTDPAPYVEITFTATSPVITSQRAYTFFAKASDRNDYTFSGNANISILKVNGNEQHPVVTVLACAAPSITTQPSGQTVTYGNNATFTFQTGTATYQWQESVNGGGSWNNISNGGIYSGVTTNTLTLAKPPVAYNNYRYRCMATSCASVTSTDVPLTVNKAGLTVTADNKNRIYGDNNPAFTVSYSGFVSGENASSLTTQPTAASTATAASAVGNYPIEPSGGVAANYSFSYVNGTLVIGQREVTVTADAQSKTYGDDDPELEYKVTTGSLVNGDDFTGALERIAGEDVGEYAITIGDLALSGNYVLAYVGANLTIGQRTITVTADAQSKTYGDSDPALTYKITSGNLVFGNTFSGSLTRESGEDAGEYDILKGTLALSANYDLTYVGANLTIGQRAITVTADAQSKTYGDSDPALTYKITSGNLVFGNTFSGSLTRESGEDAGEYDILKGTLALSANYDLTYVGALLTIGQRAITVTADAQSKTYGDSDPALTYKITSGNLVFGNTFSGSLTRESGENIGVYAIQQGTLALSANYNLSYASANLTINTRPLTITVNSKNKLYGAPLPVLDGIETGVVASDNITVSYSTTATQASPIGIYPITATLNDPNSRLFNYTVTNTASNLTIAVVPVTTAVSTNVATQQYSDVVTFTATINNGAPVVTGANGAAVSVTFKVGNQIMGTVPFTVSGNNLTGILANKQLVEGIPGQMSPGDKTVTAIFNMPNANYGLNSNNNSGTCSLTVTKENADITYTGQDYMSLPGTSATSMTISLSATIRDLFPASDGHRGNIKNARVTFRRDSPAGVCLGAPQLVPALMTDSTTGTVVTTFTYNLTTTELQSGGANLQVYAVVENYYTGGTSDVAACITIARPGGEFVTGGGYLKNNSCAGVIAGTKDLKTNFGFNMQYTKSGSNLKGQCNIIIRSNGKIYQIKSNAVNTLVVSAATSKGTPAYFNTKANYRDITDPLNPVSLGGNMDLTVKMNDVTTGGQLDSASILIMDPNTSQVVFSSNWSGVQTKLQNLGGGNVSVRSTPSNTVTMAREAQAEEITLPAIQNPFAVKVLGNPALDHFNVNIKGSAGKISLRVVDIQGRVVEYRQNVPEGTLQLGHTYQKGFYYLEVRQGNSIRQIKLVKL